VHPLAIRDRVLLRRGARRARRVLSAHGSFLGGDGIDRLVRDRWRGLPGSFRGRGHALGLTRARPVPREQAVESPPQLPIAHDAGPLW
jgi:hypothetical protein